MKYKQAVLRKTLTGDWEEFSFTNLSRHFKVKNLSSSDILVSFEKDDVDEDQCFKIASGYIETVQISDKDQNRNSFVINNNEDIFSSNVIYIKGTGDVEVCALEGFELITANQVAITVTAENCTYSGDTTLTQGGMATITFVNAEGYNLPETITVTGAGHNWNQSTGVATLFNLSSASSVTVNCVCEQDQPVQSMKAFAVGDTIVGGTSKLHVDTALATADAIGEWKSGVSRNNPVTLVKVGAVNCLVAEQTFSEFLITLNGTTIYNDILDAWTGLDDNGDIVIPSSGEITAVDTTLQWGNGVYFFNK